ncbi:DUF5694 domain-containing protein [Ekhidna sp.]|uniref:DUF5694 domain-containing protein n=1 Tax=Ekhidna sp. TaxID=2608089 RepID=UPI003297C4C1
MKTTITLCLIGISMLGFSQESLNVTIIGTAHYFDEDYKSMQDFQSVQDFIVNLNPDIICIEAIPTSDTLSLREILPNSMKNADRLRDTLDRMTSSHKVLIGAKYYVSNDFWNAYYYWFQAQEAGDSLGYFSKYQKRLTNSEYGLMVFPAAQKLGVEKLFGIDYRSGESEFLEHNKKVLKKLVFGLKWKPLKIYLKTQKKYRKAQKEGQLMEFINGPEFQDSFPKLIDEIPRRLPKSEEARQVKSYWLKRNEIMADRLIQTAQEQDANTILLTIGSAHVTHIKQFLEAKGHSVTTYGDIISNQNN